MRIFYTGLLKFLKALMKRRKKCILMLGYEGLLLGVRHREKEKENNLNLGFNQRNLERRTHCATVSGSMDGLDKIVVNSQFI